MADLSVPGNLLNQIAGAGQSAPQFGPDWKTVIALQNQQRVQQARNALQQVYSDPNNYDAKTLQPTQNAMAQLMRASPEQGLDLSNNLAAIQQKGLQSQFTQGQVFKQIQEGGRDIAAQTTAAYEKAYPTMGAEGAQRIAQNLYTELTGPWVQQLPPQLAKAVPPNFDYVRAKGTLNTAKMQETLALKDAEIGTDVKKAKALAPVEIAKAGAIGDATLNREILRSEATKNPDLHEGIGPNGQKIAVIPSGNGWVAFGNQGDIKSGTPVEVKNPHKVGTKSEADAADAMTPTGPQDLHGEDYLKELPQSRASLIKGYAEGRIPIPSSFALGKPAWEKVLADLTQYDPNFDAINYQSRYRTRQDFTSGKSAQNITSFNTAIGHLGTLKDASEGLGNRWSPMYNTVANLVESATGDPRVVRFNTAKQAVAEELERAFRGTGGNLTSIQEWQKNIDSSNSPEQLEGAISQAVNLLGSRIDSVGEQYRRGMGTTADVTELLTPAAKKTLSKLPNGQEILNEAGMRRQGTTGQTVEPGPASAAPAQPVAPSAGGNTPPLSALKEGQATTFANGQTWTLKNGKPERVAQ